MTDIPIERKIYDTVDVFDTSVRGTIIALRMNISLFGIFFIAMNQLTLILMNAINENGSVREMVECISQIAVLTGQNKVAINFYKDGQDFASEIIKKIKIPVVLNVVEIRKATGIEYRTSNGLTLLLKDEEPEKILKSTLWNGDTRFLLAPQDRNKIEEYFEHFWLSKVINVFAVISDENGILVYSFLPYQKHDCKRLKVIVVDACHEGKLKYGGFVLKDPRRIKDMNQCPVNITVTEARPSVIVESVDSHNHLIVKGIEGNLMTEISRLYNFKAYYKLPEDGVGWGWIHPSPHGALGDVYLGVSDIAIGMLGPLLDRYENLDFSKTYNVDECVTFAVPRGYGINTPAWITIFVFEFTFYTWTLLTFSFFMIIIILWLTNRYLNLKWFGSKTELVMVSFSSFLGAPIKAPNYTSVKTSIIFWVFFSFILTTTYKTSMGSKLTVPSRDPDIYTFKELINSDLKLTGVKNMCQLLASSNNWNFKNLRKRYHITNYSVEYAISRIAKREKLAHLRHRTTFYYYSMINPEARGRIHVIRDCVYLYHPMTMTKKFSPFTYRVSQIITRLEESGIMLMWREKYKKNIPLPSKPFYKLSLRQMSGIFYALCLGFLTALLSFLCEIFLKNSLIVQFLSGRMQKTVTK